MNSYLDTALDAALDTAKTAGRRLGQAALQLRDRAASHMARARTAWAARGASALAAHDAASHMVRQVASWRPQLRSADADTLPDMDTARARARDLTRNDGFLRNAARINQDSVVGPALKLSLRPDHVVLGIDEAQARAWARDVERKWELWAGSRYADARRMQNFHQLLRTAETSHFVDGEALVVTAWRKPPPGVAAGTCFQLIDPDRLETPAHMSDSARLRRGVERNRWGEPVAYYIRESHAADYAVDGLAVPRWKRIPRRTRWGRLNVIHLFDHDRPEMSRGITRLAAAIKPAKVLGQYQDVTLERAIIQSIFAAAVKTTINYDEALKTIGADRFRHSKQNPLTAMAIDYMAQTADYHREAGFGWQGAQAIHLLPNEELELFRSEAADRSFADFERAVLRQIAAATGAPVTALSQNYADVNYSAARAAMLDVWRHYLARREDVINGLAWPMFEAWLEEAVAVGHVSLPDGVDDWFAARYALMRGRWYSWGKPMIDPVKERRAQEMALNMGVTTMEEICAAEGRDWEEVLEQRARETERLKELGLEPWEIAPQLMFSAPSEAFADSQSPETDT